MNTFKIPVVLFIFKRKDTVLRIIEQLKIVKPEKIYLLADAGRNNRENELVNECRFAVEKAINWECTIIKNYAEINRGVHAQIGMGALWVFEREEQAIFLEDDNLPKSTFFKYCEMCLEKYRTDEDIFWICGTNYLEECTPSHGNSVFASKHLMPCGWASWAWKFKKYYDFELKLTEKDNWRKILRSKYEDYRLYKQQLRSIECELERKNRGEHYRSWDFHTALSIRMNDLYGIVPCNNQIKNIGVDEFSTHGGSSMDLVMTKRFCGIDFSEMPDQIVLPNRRQLDTSFEYRIGKIILYPLKARIILHLRDRLNVPEGTRLREAIFGRKR